MAGASEGIELLAREVHDFVLAQAPSNGYDWKVCFCSKGASLLA